MTIMTGVKERVHYAYELRTPGTLSLHDESFVILQVAVPPQDFVEGDVLHIGVGEVGERESSFRSPLRPLIDMYRAELREVADVYLRIEKKLDQLLEETRQKRETFVDVQFGQLAAIHRELRSGPTLAEPYSSVFHFSPQIHAAVGIILARAILVPPRRSVNVRCDKGSEVTVYLGGLASRTVR